MIRLVILAGFAWAIGLAVFACTLPKPAAGESTDGIVVLTGAAGRLQRGLALLEQDKARRLLISGVEPRVRARELQQVYHIPSRLMGRIDLGRQSVDTRSNADEAAAWIATHHYRSIRLVTSDWHMPRARLELGLALPPETVVLPDPVESEPRPLPLVREYNKYLLRRAAPLLDRLGGLFGTHAIS